MREWVGNAEVGTTGICVCVCVQWGGGGGVWV